LVLSCRKRALSRALFCLERWSMMIWIDCGVVLASSALTVLRDWICDSKSLRVYLRVWFSDERCLALMAAAS
jgi:hypothetical protein